MTPSSKLRTTGLLAVGLAAGAMLSPIGFAGAQDDEAPDAATSETPEASEDGRAGRGHRHHRGIVLEALGIDAETVRAGLAEDLTLVEIAEANGVDEADLIAAIEADVAEHLADAVESGRLTQEEADEKTAVLTESITERVNTPPSERPARADRGNRGRFRGQVLEELGLSIEDIQEGREAGQTLAETAAANGIEEEDLVSAIVAQATERADAAVENGRIDADEAAERLDGLEERIIERINAEPGDRPERGERPGRGDSNEPADA